MNDNQEPLTIDEPDQNIWDKAYGASQRRREYGLFIKRFEARERLAGNTELADTLSDFAQTLESNGKKK